MSPEARDQKTKKPEIGNWKPDTGHQMPNILDLFSTHLEQAALIKIVQQPNLIHILTIILVVLTYFGDFLLLFKCCLFISLKSMFAITERSAEGLLYPFRKLLRKYLLIR